MTLKTWKRLLLAAAAAGLIGAACQSGETAAGHTLGRECEETADCTVGLNCFQGTRLSGSRLS